MKKNVVFLVKLFGAFFVRPIFSACTPTGVAFKVCHVQAYRISPVPSIGPGF